MIQAYIPETTMTDTYFHGIFDGKLKRALRQFRGQEEGVSSPASARISPQGRGALTPPLPQ
jgi:hypothetical protein